MRMPVRRAPVRFRGCALRRACGLEPRDGEEQGRRCETGWNRGPQPRLVSGREVDHDGTNSRRRAEAENAERPSGAHRAKALPGSADERPQDEGHECELGATECEHQSQELAARERYSETFA